MPMIEAAHANASPQQFIGRGLKVAKEEIIGLLEALRPFVAEDDSAELATRRSMCEHVGGALARFPALNARVEQDEYDYLSPHAVITFSREWAGRGRDAIRDAMIAADPPIDLHDIHRPDELAVDPLNLDAEELEIVVRRLLEELSV